MIDVIIENMVVSTALESSIDLEKISSMNSDASYLPDEFPGVVFHFDEIHMDVILLHDKILSIGARNFDKAKEGILKVLEKLREQGFQIREKTLEIENIIASCDFETTLPLDKVKQGLMEEDVTYQPGEFPGLIYRYNDHIVFLVFQRGIVICVGAKSVDELLRVIKDFKEKLASIEGVAI